MKAIKRLRQGQAEEQAWQRTGRN